jgi:hypothetical protein
MPEGFANDLVHIDLSAIHCHKTLKAAKRYSSAVRLQSHRIQYSNLWICNNAIFKYIYIHIQSAKVCSKQHKSVPMTQHCIRRKSVAFITYVSDVCVTTSNTCANLVQCARPTQIGDAWSWISCAKDTRHFYKCTWLFHTQLTIAKCWYSYGYGHQFNDISHSCLVPSAFI